MWSSVCVAAGALVLVVLILVAERAAAIEPAPTAASVTAAGPGELTIDTAPTEIGVANSVIAVRVANKGGGPVRAVAVEADAPPGVTATVVPPNLGRLAAGSSVLARITARGLPESRPAVLVVRVTGRSDAGPTAALTSVGLVAAEPAASLTLVGNSRLTDASPADLVAVVGNLADVPITVLVRATAGQHIVRLAAEVGDVGRAAPGVPLAMTVPARQSAVVLVQVQAHRPLRRGTAALVVTATVHTHLSAAPTDITASRQLEVALSADVLPGMIGVGSVLVIPGLVAIWAVLTVLYLDRRRLGLPVRSVGGQIWDNKLWLLAAAGVSLLAAVLYSAAGFADLLDTYTLGDIAVVTAVSGLLGAAASAVAVWAHRLRVPAVTPMSTELSVLKAAGSKETTGVSRRVYRTSDGKRGVYVHTDWGVIVLTPPIEYTEIDGIENVGSLQQAVGKIDGAEDHIRFRQSGDNEYVAGPCAVPEATPCGWDEILQYVDVDDFKKNAAP